MKYFILEKFRLYGTRHAHNIKLKNFPAFPVAPSEQVVPVMTPAIFQCQPVCHVASITTVWIVNNASLNMLGNSQYITTTDYGVGSGENGRISALNITALSEFNSTTIECVVIFFGDSESPPQASPTVNLWIQGRSGFHIALMCYFALKNN